MRYQELLEHYVNLFAPEDKQKYATQVWQIMQTSYKDSGGFHSAASVEELINKTDLWKLCVRNGHVYAAFLYKDKLGRKSIASGTDGTDQGKRDYAKVKGEDFKLQRAWAEVSGKVEKLMQRAKATPIPNSLASVLTGKEILDLNPDGYHYTRFIQGHPHEKIIYGFINLDAKTAEMLTAQGIDLSDLPDNIKMK